MKELILIRHGETDSNKRGAFLGWTDVDLNRNGIKQSEDLAHKLKGENIEKIFCSPLKRTLETAKIINSKLSVEIEKVEGLKERNFGVWDNLTFEEIKERFPNEHALWMKNPEFCIHKAETNLEIINRVKSSIDSLIKNSNEDICAIVTHSGCIRIIITYLLGMKDENVWRFKIENGCFSKIVFNEENYAYLTKLNG